MKNGIDVAFAFLYAVRKSLTNFVSKKFLSGRENGAGHRDLCHISSGDEVSGVVSARPPSLVLVRLVI